MIDAQGEQNFLKLAVNDCATEKIFSRSFLTACLLTGTTGKAEKAVMEAIGLWNPDEQDGEQLFQMTLRTAVQSQATVSSAVCDDEGIADFWLPIELRRVLQLSPEIRSCFVFRVLVGLPSHVCAQILHVDICQVDQYFCNAMRSLAALDSVQTLNELVQ